MGEGHNSDNSGDCSAAISIGVPPSRNRSLISRSRTISRPFLCATYTEMMNRGGKRWVDT
jgi:hypothetical protein